MSVPFEIPDWLIPTDDPPPDTSAVDPHRVEDLVNRFIAGKQDALFTGPDAYYRTTSGDAVQRLPYITNRLIDLKNEQLAEPLPYYPQSSAGLVPENLIQPLTDGDRAALGERLDAHIADAMDGINRHITAQRDVFNRQTIAERQRLIQRAATLEHNNDDKLAGLAEAHASAAQELARMNGEPKAAAMDAARSAIWRTAIDQHLANGNGPQAIDLFDRMKDQLAPGDQRHLEMPIQHAALNRTADQWIDRERPEPGESLLTRLQADPDLSPIEKAIVRLKLDAHDSVQESDRAATVKGLDDRLDTVAQALTTAPATYRPGALSTLMNAYEDAGAADSAATLRPVATHEPLLLPFAQLSADKQKAALDALPDEARPAAEAIQRDQAAAFARDALSAGTTLYPDVGAPVPADDIAGRIIQARKIAERQGMPVAPFTAAEIAGIRQTLADGPPTERDAVVTRINALPDDMKAALMPLLAPPRAIASDTANDDALHRGGVQLAKADGGDASAGQTQDRSVHIDTDFEIFEREIEKDRERVAAEHAAESSGGQGGGAPPTEPAPGSPEYQAADAEARRIVAEQDATPPTSARTASAAALPAAGDGGAEGPAVGEALKDFGATAVRALPTIVRGASAPVVAGTILLIPGNTGSTLRDIGDGLRLRINPDERAVRIERRVDNGVLNTGIGAKWEELPIKAEQVDTPDGRRIVAIDGAGLKQAIGDEAFAGLNVQGIAMAKPPSDGDKPDDNQRPVGMGHNDPPEPMEPEPPPLNPAPAAVPIINNETPPPSGQEEGDEVRRRRIREAAEYIGAGHARTEHLEQRREYPGVTPLEFVNMIEQTMLHPSYYRDLPNSGRKAYWDAKSNLLVVEDPNVADRGTAFRRVEGPKYIRQMKDR